MQLSLLDQLAPRPDPSFSTCRRRDLGEGAWVDYAPEWLSGHFSMFCSLRDTADWERHRRNMYDRIVWVPRLVAPLPGSTSGFHFADGEVSRLGPAKSGQEVVAARRQLESLGAILSARYRKTLTQISLGYYRSGADSVAFHGDKLGSLRADTVVAIVSVGERRRFLLRPRGGRTRLAFQVGAGDLLVMGGSCQLTWEHAVPKVKSANERIAIMFRESPPEQAAVAKAASVPQAAAATGREIASRRAPRSLSPFRRSG